MTIGPGWRLNHENLIAFVMVDATGAEVPGLGNAYTIHISKNGGAWEAGAGVRAEIGNGWYTYLATADESDTIGTIAIRVTGGTSIQQNLEYVVVERTIGAITYTYTLLSNTPPNPPIEDARVWFATDANGDNVVWRGITDAFGVARDLNSNLPRLDAGTYFVFRRRVGFIFDDPDVQIVS